MMSGNVSGRHALVPITLRRDNGPDLTIEFVVDTGFTYDLTLPPAAVAALGLPLINIMAANLADDSTIQVSVHAANIAWQDQEISVRVLAMGVRPLLGMALLEGSELVIQCADNGLVTIDTL